MNLHEPKKHDVSFLLEYVGQWMEVPAMYIDYADILTPYGVVVRYPNELHIAERNAHEALQYASEILQWAKEMVEQISKG